MFQSLTMPPKKKEVEEKQVLIGRMGTNLKCGIVGKHLLTSYSDLSQDYHYSVRPLSNGSEYPSVTT